MPRKPPNGVILPLQLTAGLTHSSIYTGGDRILTITAGTGTITFN